MSDKHINMVCGCLEFLVANNNIIALLPCEHLIHYDCIDKIKHKRCPICYKKLTHIKTFKEVKRDKFKSKDDYQLYVDMRAVRTNEKFSSSNLRLATRVPELMIMAGQIPFIKSVENVINLADDIMDICNIKINVINKNKIYDGRKVIISNHVNYIDPLPIADVIPCGFVASSFVRTKWATRKVVDNYPILVIKRGQKGNVVNKMKEYLDTVGDICVFPEGAISSQDTLTRFRTGAFRTDYPVQPVVIKFNPDFYTPDLNQFAYNLVSQKKIEVTITILNPEFPPFDDAKIENIRKKMAKTGGFALSRVSNRDINE